MSIYKTIDHLPAIGENICVFFDGEAVLASIISMAECKELEPDLFGKDPKQEAHQYAPHDTIRAYRLDRPHKGRSAGFCIMQFRDERHPLGAEYNRNITQPSGMGLSRCGDSACWCRYGNACPKEDGNP